MIGAVTTGKISVEEVEHIAWLAKIELSQDEKELFTKQFNTILEYFEMINEVDTKDIQPTTQVVEEISALREDRVVPSLSIDDALSNATLCERRFFKAPKII
jgi:aspartyl-tRNA(Asn)/glutamyl-tRNA(Gln) amidotransferase subunit C